MRLGTATTTIVTGIVGVGTAAGAAAFAVSASPAMTLTAATVSSPAMCGDGPWIGPNGIDVEGRPAFDAGDSGAAYIGHGSDGWHLRTTDALAGSHHYSGSITVSPDATVTSLQPVMLEPNDHVWLSGGGRVIDYDFTTQTGVDGFDFTVSSCAGSKAHEALQYALDYNGREQDVARIKLGPNRAHPLFATFDVYRSV